MEDRPVEEFVPCTLKMLHPDEQVQAARYAIAASPRNLPLASFFTVATGLILDPYHLAVLSTRMWPQEGVHLTVGFPFDQPSQALKEKILFYMNRWGEYGNVQFSLTNVDPQIRIARTPGQGYYSYLGTDILQIHRDQPTMNLASFTLNTPDSEYKRVVIHETGHSLGFPHEHLRRELVNRLDPQKTIEYFRLTQGWSAQVTRQQVLTALEDASIIGTASADQTSIMAYHLPGSITKDGRPIVGGVDIDTDDAAFVARIYPKVQKPSPPPPEDLMIEVMKVLEAGKYKLVKV